MGRDNDGLKAGLLKQNILLLNNEVSGPMVDYVYACLAELECRGSPAIETRLFTNGGSVGAGLDIYDALVRYKGQKTGVVYAYARSMGAVILQACDKRVCLQHASVLIHHVNQKSVSLDVLEDEQRLAELRESMRVDQRAIYEILVRRTGRTEEEIRAVCKKNEDMDAVAAKAFGLIDEIEIAVACTKPEVVS